jgi:cytochrome b subunit of formate dehydrogenase
VRIRKTDYGTIILHWVLVGGISVALVTGLRMATEGPDHLWVNMFDSVLPRTHVWVPHIWASVILVAVSLAYAVYVTRSGLSRRVQIDKARLRALVGKRQVPRLGAFSAVLTWTFFLSMVALIISGGCLYFGVCANHFVRQVHWYATWTVLGFIALHVLNHAAIGGASQLTRIFRPERLPAPPPRLDAVELLTMLVEQSERLTAGSEPVAKTPVARAPAARAPMQAPLQPAQTPSDASGGRQDPPWKARNTREERMMARRATSVAPKPAAPNGPPKRRRNPTFQANPFVIAAAVAITGASLVLAADRYTDDVLTMHRIDSADAPVLDGDTSDRVWRNIEPIEIMTNQGGNLDGKGDSRVEIRAAHDGTWAYFLFTWEDPTRSLKQLPLVKQRDGWHMLHNGYENGDEHGSDLPCQSAADCQHACDQDRPRPALHHGRGHLCRRVAVEGDQRRPDRLAGR